MTDAHRRREHERRLARRGDLARNAWLDVNGEAVAERLLRRPILRRLPRVPEKPDTSLRLVTLNVAHGRRRVPHQAFVPRRYVERNLEHIAGALKHVEADVVALQEADGPSAWSGNIDHVATLAELIELEDHYRGDHNPFGLASGTALMARLPLLEPFSHRFESSWRDTKGFVVATLAVPEWNDVEIDVVSVHLDFLAHTIRRKQILRMIDTLAERRRPLVVLGDLNCCWQREPRSIEMLLDTLGLRAHELEHRAPTYPTYRPRRRLDWILISEQLDFHGYHTLPASLSDHLGVVADLGLRNGSGNGNGSGR